ncbi:carboxypeptidase-like regulatory domain-containing protein [Algoriphagus lutimaris]|uniref:carboxypeptidase-like regulatory domain-containing protein n=1 Tax=Algoriphagus lutimaris TaxID=613197 RepID=UPI00196A6A1E|nr:carboxypeptidase-like regulatory domain-containing protein [Algoriphagus lutimaris]MBN3519484.1 carboxypeptidase-like regulatory domain-containing protein [Algoriphagus lutimaris]
MFFRPLQVIFLFFQVQFILQVNAQTIRGKVIDSKTKEPLQFTNVFINNTTIGTTTNEEGSYTLSRPDLPGTFQLVASFVGYSTSSIEVSIGEGETKSVDFLLIPLESVLSEIELKSRRDKPWERHLKRFQDVFLAVSDDPIAGELEITNPWVLEFEKVKTDKGPNYIQASAQEPLILENDALGYKVTYYLQDYKFYNFKSSFYGLAFFENKMSKDSAQSAEYLLNKQTSYLGSIKHLMRSILLQQVPEQGFSLYETFPEQMNRRRTNTYTIELGESIVPISQDSIRRIPLRNGNFRIIWPQRVEVHFLKKNYRNDYYLDIYHPVGWVEAPLGYFDIDRNGVPIHPTQVVLSGYIGRPRMGRSLPHDYFPSETFENLAAEVDLLKGLINKWENLRESPYLMTNKPYYYPGETVWFGGKMLYKNQFYQDTLSRVLHVDLISEGSEVVLSNQYPIENGGFSGSISLPDSLPQGDYFIRAYTEWMRNYPERDFYLRAFPVLGKGLNIESQDVEQFDFLGDLEFQMKDSIYFESNQQVLEMELSIKDALDELVNAEMMISATNPELVSDMKGQSNFIEAYEWLNQEEKNPLSVIPKFDIEYGVSISGNFEKDKKRQPDINPITIVRGDLADYGVVKTDSTGFFRATGLYFFEMDTLSFAALDNRGKAYGSINLKEKTSPLVRGSFPKLRYSIYQVNDRQMYYDSYEDYILLEEFVAEDEKIESLADRFYGYGEPDQVYSREDLDNWPGNSLDQIIGMRFGNGAMGNYNYGLEEGEPLIILDGARYAYNEDETAKDVLQNILTDEVISMAVYTLNANSFGLAGFAGVIMIETKRGERFSATSDKKFNDTGFQKFPIRGFAEVNSFLNEPSLNRSVVPKPSLYWNPNFKLEGTSSSFKIYVPNGVSKINIRIEGVTEEGIPFWKTFPLHLN